MAIGKAGVCGPMSKPITGAGIATTSPMAAGDLPILRFLTCGSVDDGKSTLIGRLLFDTKLIEEDSLQALEQASRTHGTTGSQIDLALLLDGLQAERQQGITIDVAYRCFTTPRRKFIVADTPGHEQYTRNMVTGASHCDVAVILVDARKGIVKQTRRHTCIVDLLGIRNVVLAINKMDLVDFAQDRFDAIEAMYRDFVKNLAITEITALPLSALMGDNVVTQSPKMGWYGGPTLLDHLESVNVVAPAIAEEATALRMPVQWICGRIPTSEAMPARSSPGSCVPGSRSSLCRRCRQHAFRGSSARCRSDRRRQGRRRRCHARPRDRCSTRRRSLLALAQQARNY